MNSVARPTGITILAILALIGGVWSIVVALGALFFGAIVAGVGGTAESVMIGGIGFVVGLVALASGLFWIAFAYGSWTAKAYGWALGIIAALIGVVQAILNFVGGDATLVGLVVSLVIPGIVLYYLNTPNVKAYFGRT